MPWGYDFEAMILFCKKALVHRIIQMRKLLVRVEFLLARTTGNVLFRTLLRRREHALIAPWLVVPAYSIDSI